MRFDVSVKINPIVSWDEASETQKDEALNFWRQTDYVWVSESIWENDGEELLDSVKAVSKLNGVPIKDWNISEYGPSWIRWEWPWNDAESLEGKRAIAWLENNLLNHLRVPYGIKDISGPYSIRKWSVKVDGYSPGQVNTGALTGMWSDHVIISALIDSVNTGDTLGDAFENLGSVIARYVEDQTTYAYSMEYLETELRPDLRLGNDWQVVGLLD